MKKIILTRGMFAIVDERDFERLSKHKWYALKTSPNGNYYARRRISSNPSKHQYMHREITGCTLDMEVHHKDTTTLDNRRSNLLTMKKSINANYGKKYRYKNK